MDRNDFYDLDFFPSFQADIARFHRRYAEFASFIFPFLVPFRGCPTESCEPCAGARSEQRRLFRRGPVVRSASRFADDLARLGRDDRYRFACCVWDFISLMPASYAQEALRRPSRLKLKYELALPPDRDALALLQSSFQGGMLSLYLGDQHCLSRTPNEPAVLAPLLRQARQDRRYTVVLVYIADFARETPDYLRALIETAKQTGCLVRDASRWFDDFPRPNEDGNGRAADFDKFLLHPPLMWHRLYDAQWSAFRFLSRLLPRAVHVTVARAGMRVIGSLALRLRRSFWPASRALRASTSGGRPQYPPPRL